MLCLSGELCPSSPISTTSCTRRQLYVKPYPDGLAEDIDKGKKICVVCTSMSTV